MIKRHLQDEKQTLEQVAESYLPRLKDACCFFAGCADQSQPPENHIKPYTMTNVALLIGAVLIGEYRNTVIAETELSCSGGIGENKLLAKSIECVSQRQFRFGLPGSS